MREQSYRIGAGRTYAKGHVFDPHTETCECGVGKMDIVDKGGPSHDDAMNPGTVEKEYRQRSTGHVIKYRVPKK